MVGIFLCDKKAVCYELRAYRFCFVVTPTVYYALAKNAKSAKSAIGVTDRDEGYNKGKDPTNERYPTIWSRLQTISDITDSTGVDENTADDKHQDGDNLQDRQPVLYRSICLDSCQIDQYHDEIDDERNEP